MIEDADKVFPMPLVVDQEKTTAYLEEHEGELNRDAVDYGLTRENGEFKIIEGQDGIVVDVAKSVDTIDESFQAGWKADSTIELVAEVSKPKGSEEELQKVKDVLGTFSTKNASKNSSNYGSNQSQNRMQNQSQNRSRNSSKNQYQDKTEDDYSDCD